MRRVSETSYGVFPLRQTALGWQVLMVQHRAGHWAFPKGHHEEGETRLETAARELAEETGLQIVKLLQKEPLSENYHFMRDGCQVEKHVSYFLAEVAGEAALQLEELQAIAWVDLQKAEEKATFPEAKKLCGKLLKILSM